MTLSAVSLQVYEPGERADELLAAVARTLGYDTLTADENGNVGPIGVSMPAPRARELMEEALTEAGDEGRLVVKVNY